VPAHRQVTLKVNSVDFHARVARVAVIAAAAKRHLLMYHY
jgi:hypothetical protein